ncbi:MAG: hypothetical protein FJ390_04220 [Verrucomicrobia bacterium]|nr:hypothetical protein [Verrucomicrobiota bacterium]
MKTKFYFLLSAVLLLAPLSAALTHREKQCENQDVIVWKTIIEPNQPLVMHRHDHRRVVVALTDVDLLVKNDRGQSHRLIMKRGTARILLPDRPKELHCDINQSHHPMEVMVIEFKK